MRVLLLSSDPGIPWRGPSGASSHLRALARAWLRRGAEVRVAVPCVADARGSVADDAPVSIVTSPPRRHRWLPPMFRDLGESWDARRLARAAVADGWRPDLVWERFSGLGDGGGLLGAPWILEVNAPVVAERAAVGRNHHDGLAAWRQRAILRSAPRIVTVSSWLSGWVVREGAVRERVRTVPNGVEAVAGDRSRGRARWGLDGPVLGFVGSCKPAHGLRRLPALLDALPEFTAVVAGDGPSPPPDHPRLRRLGRVDEALLPDLIAGFDVGLAPYGPESPPWFSPLKVAEYRAQGAPWVTSPAGASGLPDAEGGVIVAVDTPGAWADAVRRAVALSRVPRVRPWDAVLDEALAEDGPPPSPPGLPPR